MGKIKKHRAWVESSIENLGVAAPGPDQTVHTRENNSPSNSFILLEIIFQTNGLAG